MTSKQVGQEDPRFWRNIIKAARCEPREPRPLRGASGQRHDLLAIGLDELGKRLVVVSGEHDARSAVLAQYDLQTAVRDYRVVTVRPAAVSVPKLARALQAAFGSPIINEKTLAAIAEDKELLPSILEQDLGFLNQVRKHINLRAVPQVLELIQQVAKIKFETSDFQGESGTAKFSIDLSSIVDYDPIASDRALGICAIPLYDFKEKQIEAISSAESDDDVILILAEHDIYQYFFPGPDSLALGLVDRGVHDSACIENEIATAPALGHPLGQMEIVERNISPVDVIDALQERKLLVEGEIGFELSEDGKTTRYSVKFKPKEGIISKLINQISIRLDLKDLLKGLGGG